MSQYLPTGNFKLAKEIGDVTKIRDSNKTEHILDAEIEILRS